MRTEEITIYTFKELSEESKQKAIEKARYWQVELDWWDYVYEDAERIGAKIGAFELDRQWSIEIELQGTVGDTVQSILSEHGKDCDTYKLAQEYFRRKHIKAPMDAAEFSQQLGECYLTMLQRESEYLTSDESVIESLQAGEYEFTADGEMY